MRFTRWPFIFFLALFSWPLLSAQNGFYPVDGLYLVQDNPSAWQLRQRLIDQAQESIVLLSAFFDQDATGERLLARLEAAAERGVEVAVLVDKNSARISKLRSQEARQKGVQWREHEPEALFSFIHWLYPKMHEKLLLVDHRFVVVGGRNIGDHNFGRNPDKNQQNRELLIYRKDGFPALHSHLTALFTLQSHRSSQTFVPLKKFGYALDSMQKGDRQSEGSLEKAFLKEISAHVADTEFAQAKFYFNSGARLSRRELGGAQDEKSLSRALETEVAKAQKEILIETPYAVIGEPFEKLFFKALERGVSVSIYTNSWQRPKNSIAQAYYESRKREWAKAGIKIFERKQGPFVHGKAWVFDQRRFYIGSYNLDFRSHAIDIESGFLLENRDLAQKLRKDIKESSTWIRAEESPLPEFSFTWLFSWLLAEIFTPYL